MSGDVQPRKRKDKRRRKDELSVEEPRGTAAVFGEGDVFMHSQHEHGTGGHWCAKVIFFSLLAILVTLIGLIILENRGLSELEANSVESRYSGVLEGWLEDTQDDNHHDEHTLELKHHEEGDEDESAEDEDIEVEKIEKEVSDEDVLEEAAASSVEEKQEDDKSAEQSEEEETPEEGQTGDDDEFLKPEDIEEPVVVERIIAPAGKPLPEVEEGASTEKPSDTLAEEEEYEKQQEELRRQKDQASHLWLKVAVGGALLVATHAVIRRATAPRDPSLVERTSREDSPSTIDRRMTLIPEESSIDEPDEIPEIVREVEKAFTATAQSVPLPSEKSEEEDDEELDLETKNEETTEMQNDDEHKELYSDDENQEEEEPEVEVKEDVKESVEESKDIKEPKEQIKNVEPDEEIPEDVEIIDEELLEEEIIEEEEEDEEEISDVDDAELLSRLEAKYGRLPEPERPGPKKDGGNSLEDEWPGEPSEQYWRQQLDEAERELREAAWSAAERRASAPELRGSARARYVRARALDAAAEARRDNRLLSQSIAAYLELLKMNERLSDKKLLEITNRTLDRIRFRGNYLNAEPVYRLLIRRFPDDPEHRNNLSISFLMANRADLAEEVLKETLRRWPDDRVALAHLGFVLKTSHNKLEEAVDAMRKALEGDIGAANEPRFYFHLGDALLLLGRYKEAEEVHKRGAALGHFLSPAQRSLYNVERLKSRSWWNIEQTPYARLARNLEASWKTILKEGEAARALYEQEKEGLKERGEWSQLDIFVRGQEIPGRCKKAPITCSIVRQELAAVGCKRGQIKFSAMEAGTHVRPHVGPTNCRLRMHLGLSNTKDTYIRVDKEIRQWQAGKVLMFDDSFEHEVWHNGTGSRLVLIVDVWHPDLTPAERRTLPAI
ncbi:aspartyl/asparaginyl beta-hydroxylase isoform X2 [Manduca sexta]|uniref:aspartyl/asparaginyl beta-hydroxylase isoform X2 n=1 Tax=Manduca sexta TaxID=7130 RepID=UPI0018902F94|nr:aspartyl/asparaginyl beta-hydroxylase isoform X2 [Manduca sexta]